MRAVLATAGSGYAIVVLVLSAVHLAAPQRDGPLALSQVGAPFLFVALLLFVPVAVVPLGEVRRSPPVWRTLLRLLLAACLVVAVVRFGPVWVSLPPADQAGQRIHVMTWNLEAGSAEIDAVVAHLREQDAGVVALEELGKPLAAAIKDDADVRSRFPHQLAYANDGSLGMGLLSSYPILESGRIAEDPPLIWARLDVGGGRTLSVIAAHPLPGHLRSVGGLPLPIDYVVATRDAQIRTVREVVASRLTVGDPLVLAGDFNVTDREPAYTDLAAGLLDAHLEVGLGPGSTWRPDPIKWLPFGILRIDMVLSGNGAQPISIGVDCAPRGSDHCVVEAVVALP